MILPIGVIASGKVISWTALMLCIKKELRLSSRMLGRETAPSTREGYKSNRLLYQMTKMIQAHAPHIQNRNSESVATIRDIPNEPAVIVPILWRMSTGEDCIDYAKKGRLVRHRSVGS
ncbi:MAG: hypothetical protein LBI05_12235 [Planctomycetaceae bacterium]|jgi:hypothetical protein|nr:hypothetical protein [Planctomycetaceae bacterium]